MARSTTKDGDVHMTDDKNPPEEPRAHARGMAVAQMLGHAHVSEAGDDAVVVVPGMAPEGIDARAAKMRDQLQLITTREELDGLPDNSIILAEIMEYVGPPVPLMKMKQSWSAEYVEALGYDPCWYTFLLFPEGLEPIDDYTPELPALVLVEGYEDDEDYEEDE